MHLRSARDSGAEPELSLSTGFFFEVPKCMHLKALLINPVMQKVLAKAS